MKLILVFLSGLFLLGSCGKYPDGPSFSLATKKARMAGIWDLQETQTPDGNTYANNDDRTITLKKNKTMSIELANATYSGSWDFMSDHTQVRFDYNNFYDYYTIRRLTKNELWLQESDNGNIMKYKNLGK